MQTRPNFLLAFLPLLFLIGLLALNVQVFGDDALSYPNQLALLAAGGVAGIVGLILKTPFKMMMDGVIENLQQATPALLVLLMIGALAGSWLFGGVVPVMIYGLKILHPDYFLFTACIISAVVSLATGSSWGTIATVGIALLGIGKTMDIHVGLSAGAIISGAYFGDKMSPLSDTTNLAPAVAGTDLFSHIRYMTITTIPSILLTLLIFLIIGLSFDKEMDIANVAAVNDQLEATFSLSPLLFLVPLVVIGLIVKRVPAVPALAIGSVLGIAAGFVFQGDMIEGLVAQGTFSNTYAAAVTALGSDFQIPSTNPLLNDLLSAGGMSGMLGTIWLIMCAMVFGGIMEKSGCLETISRALLSMAHGQTGLVSTTAASSIFMNLTASDQYLAIVVPGKMYQKAYEERGLDPVNLSRTLEDAGTVTSVLVPWNTCGAAQAGVLGVATAVYWPFCFFCLISPAMTILVSALNYRVKKLNIPTQPE
ncbi:MAG: Na+/H+ antiporter NhaC [Flavobacteriales bacterium]|nr:Na+/H+ antiporter NhaC [Flavobacteriales bacterium]